VKFCKLLLYFGNGVKQRCRLNNRRLTNIYVFYQTTLFPVTLSDLKVILPVQIFQSIMKFATFRLYWS